MPMRLLDVFVQITNERFPCNRAAFSRSGNFSVGGEKLSTGVFSILRFFRSKRAVSFGGWLADSQCMKYVPLVREIFFEMLPSRSSE